MSDCANGGRNVPRRPLWRDQEWRTLPSGDEVHGPADVELSVIEVELSDGTGRTKLLPLPQGVAVVGVKLDGERYVRARVPDWDAEGWDD